MQLQELDIHKTAIIIDPPNHETLQSQKKTIALSCLRLLRAVSVTLTPAHTVKMHPCHCVATYILIFFQEHLFQTYTIIHSFYFSHAPMQSKSLLASMFLSSPCHMPLFICLPYPNSTFLFPFTLYGFC